MHCFCISYQRKYEPGGQFVTGPIHATYMKREKECIQAPKHHVVSEILITLDPIRVLTYLATSETLVTSDSIQVSTYPATSEILITSDQQTKLDLMEIEEIEEVEGIEGIEYSEESSTRREP